MYYFILNLFSFTLFDNEKMDQLEKHFQIKNIESIQTNPTHNSQFWYYSNSVLKWYPRLFS